jgi:hypothetical protein
MVPTVPASASVGPPSASGQITVPQLPGSLTGWGSARRPLRTRHGISSVRSCLRFAIPPHAQRQHQSPEYIASYYIADPVLAHVYASRPT